jgi:hypothetical protein
VEFTASPGVVLGPLEAYCAELMWFREIVSAADLPEKYGPRHDRPLQIPPVAWQLRQRILQAGLVYGQLDTSAAGPRVVGYIDAAMFKNGMLLHPETWEAQLSDRWNSSPFKRSENVRLTPEGKFVLEIDGEGLDQAPIREDAAKVPEAVIVAVEHYLERVGYQKIAGLDLKTYSQQLRAMPWPPVARLDPVNAALQTMSNRSLAVAMGIHGAIERSVEQGVPFLSRDALAPAWIHTDAEAPQFEVVRAALDVPDGPSLPPTLSALAEVSADPRVADLREFVSWASDRILTIDSSAVQEVQREVRRVNSRRKRSRRATAIARVVTYMAVPVGSAEALSGVAGPGLALAGLGVLGEAVASMMRRLDRRHWISL